MNKLDITIFIFLGVLQVASAAWGGIVSAKSLQDAPHVKRFHIAAFSIMALLGGALVVAQGFRTYYQQKEASSEHDRDKLSLSKLQTTADNTNTTLETTRSELHQSALSQEFMRGQLKGLELMLGHLNETGESGNKQIAAAISKVATTNGGGETKPEFHVSYQAIPAPQPLFGKEASEFIVTTTKRMNGAHARLTCTNKIIHGSATLLGANQTQGGSGQLDDHTITSDIQSPDWSPDYPLVFIVYSENNHPGHCSVTPPQ